MSINRDKLTAKDFRLQQTLVAHTDLVPFFGQIMTSTSQSNGALEFISDFRGKKIINISGGNRKMFLFEELDESENIVTALHSEIQDQIQYQGQHVVPIDEVVISLQGSKIREIKSGKYHNIILTSQGKIYSYGKGQFGALGLGGSIFQIRPRIIRKLENKKIIQIACGMFHTLALSQIGDLFSWGRGFEGQLGLLQSAQTASTPQFVPHFFKYDSSAEVKRLQKKPISKIACGAYHSIAIDNQGSVYCWGQARSGQTGTGKKVKEPIPIKLKLQIDGNTKKIEKIAGGFAHTLCLTQQGQLFAWGLNVKGQVGLSDLPQFMKMSEDSIAYTRAVYYPVHIKTSASKQKLPVFKQISCGFNTSFAIDQHGCAWSWGGGNLGIKDKFLQRGPTRLTQGTESKIFSKVFANENSVVFFATLNTLYFKPGLVPSKGQTQITLFGNGFADTGEQHVKFQMGDFVKEIPIQYDMQTSTYYCKSPQFPQQLITTPKQCSVSITLDHKNYYTYAKKLLIYPSKLSMQTFQPKCGSSSGNSELKIYMPLHPLILQYVESISVGFKSTSKDLSQNNKYQDWLCSQGHFSEDTIMCKLPTIPLFNNDQPFYLVDVSLNGQQFTQHHQTFRFYSISETIIKPSEGFQTGNYEVVIEGKGLFDSPHKYLLLQLMFQLNENKYNCRRQLEIKWNKTDKNFTFIMPTIQWIIGDQIHTPQMIEAARKTPVILKLGVAKNQLVNIGSFQYIIPPPPEEPQQQKKDSKKQAKKGAKK